MSMQIPETEEEYRRALNDAAELGAKKALEQAGIVKPFLILAEAKRIHGRELIEFLIEEGLVTKIKDGPGNCRVRLDRMQVESAVKMCNRAEYFKYLGKKKEKAAAKKE